MGVAADRAWRVFVELLLLYYYSLIHTVHAFEAGNVVRFSRLLGSCHVEFFFLRICFVKIPIMPLASGSN